MATMTAWARYSTPPAQTANGRLEKSTRSASASTIVVPKRSAWARKRSMSSGPWIPSGKPG